MAKDTNQTHLKKHYKLLRPHDHRPGRLSRLMGIETTPGKSIPEPDEYQVPEHVLLYEPPVQRSLVEYAKLTHELTEARCEAREDLLKKMEWRSIALNKEDKKTASSSTTASSFTATTPGSTPPSSTASSFSETARKFGRKTETASPKQGKKMLAWVDPPSSIPASSVSPSVNSSIVLSPAQNLRAQHYDLKHAGGADFYYWGVEAGVWDFSPGRNEEWLAVGESEEMWSAVQDWKGNRKCLWKAKDIGEAFVVT